MRFIFTYIIFLFLSPVAEASSPGMVEGPAGCTWDAKIEGQAQGDIPVLHLTLTQVYGQCMQFVLPDICGKVGQKVDVSTRGSDTSFQVGQMTRVWVAGNAASLTPPPCTTTPIEKK